MTCRWRSCSAGICHFRPPPGSQRVERRDADRLPLRPGPRDRGPRQQGRARRSRGSSPATWPRSAAWWIPMAHAPSARRDWSSFATTLPSPINFPGQAHRPRSPTGGYSDSIVVTEHFVLSVPSNLELAGTAPLLCARHYDLFAHAALGREREQEGGRGPPGRTRPHGRQVCPCLRSLHGSLHYFSEQEGRRTSSGADEVVVSRDANEMAKHAGSFDFILDAVSADHDINAYIQLLRRDGNITLVGAPEKPLALSALRLDHGAPQLSGSPIGGIDEDPGRCSTLRQATTSPQMWEVIPSRGDELQRLLKSDVKYRLLHRYGFAQPGR